MKPAFDFYIIKSSLYGGEKTMIGTLFSNVLSDVTEVCETAKEKIVLVVAIVAMAIVVTGIVFYFV